MGHRFARARGPARRGERRRRRSWSKPMRSLREVQRGFTAAALFGDTAALAGLGIVAGALGAAARIAIYRNNVLGNYRQALAATYPVVRRLVGGSFFDAALHWLRTRTPVPAWGREPLRRRDGALPRHLSARRARSLICPTWRAWNGQSIKPTSRRTPQRSICVALAARAGRGVRAGCASACILRCRSSSRAIRSFASGRPTSPDSPGDAPVDPGEGGEVLLVRRAPDGVVIERLAPGEYAFLAALARNKPPSGGRAARRGRRAGVRSGRRCSSAMSWQQTIVAFRAPPTPAAGIRP